MNTELNLENLLLYICRNCGDPRDTHQRPNLYDKHYGPCFIMGCDCPGFELDNLKYLEKLAE